jgi:hypothetical protein
MSVSYPPPAIAGQKAEEKLMCNLALLSGPTLQTHRERRVMRYIYVNDDNVLR